MQLLCLIDCANGYYDRNCSKLCGHCKDNSPCNKINGACESGCMPNFQSPMCKGKLLITHLFFCFCLMI